MICFVAFALWMIWNHHHHHHDQVEGSQQHLLVDYDHHYYHHHHHHHHHHHNHDQVEGGQQHLLVDQHNPLALARRPSTDLLPLVSHKIWSYLWWVRKCPVWGIFFLIFFSPKRFRLRWARIISSWWTTSPPSTLSSRQFSSALPLYPLTFPKNRWLPEKISHVVELLFQSEMP